jgi:hypothetical protein
MRCSICRRPLLHCAVPGIAIGPICAKKRGLMPERELPASIFSHVPRATRHDGQLDWINQLDAGPMVRETHA